MKNKYSILLLLLLLLSVEALAQSAQWNEANAARNAQAAGGFFKMLAQMGLTILGLVGSGITGYKIFAKGQQTLELIAGLISSIIVIGIAFTIFEK